MPRYVALLRAINVGGHVVKMEKLRSLFEEMEFTEVTTFIASGNVLFTSPSKSIAEIAKRIEEHLKAALGYDVVTFLRTPKQLQKIVDLQPFPESEVKVPGSTLYIGFLANAPTKAAVEKLMAFSSPEGQLRVREREVYWLVRSRISDNKLSGSKMERVLGLPLTLRNLTTVTKLAAMK